MRTTITLGVAAGLGIAALSTTALAVPYNVNALGANHRVITGFLPIGLEDVQGFQFLYRFNRGSGGGDSEDGEGVAFAASFSPDHLKVTLDWDESEWVLEPKIVVAGAGNKWGLWMVNGWTSAHDSIELENTTIRPGVRPAPTVPLSELNFVAVYGSLTRAPVGSPGGGGAIGGGSTGVPDAPATLGLFGLGLAALGGYRRWTSNRR